MHTELTTVLDLTQTTDNLLMNMRKTTRQLVKKALKMVESGELKVIFPDKIDQEMLQVYKDTYLRGGAVAFSQKFIENEWQVFSQNSGAKLISILHEGKVVSWAMFLFVNKRAFFHQAGNILSKNLPNSYLLQWLGINEAKKQGCIRYDFWGVAPIDKPEHPWANISLFKRGFGGTDVELLHAQDLVISPLKYFPNWLLETFRAKKRGF
jgi:lipid II:glycine glycyltransferase (peptidoglycan interpeptide bridge formation enzyme)